MEEWRSIPGWEGLYEVSNSGQVRSVDRYVAHRRFGLDHKSFYKGRILRPGWSTGYAVVQLVNTGEGRREYGYVHDLVLAAFVGPKPSGQEVCHGPAGERINTLENLRYDTRQANALDRHKWGEGWKKRGCKAPEKRLCAVCQTLVLVYRRKNRPDHLCGSAYCRSEFGRICVERRDAKTNHASDDRRNHGSSIKATPETPTPERTPQVPNEPRGD
jgi:hypothetical protein